MKPDVPKAPEMTSPCPSTDYVNTLDKGARHLLPAPEEKQLSGNEKGV